MEEIIRKCLPTYRVTDRLGEGVYGSVYRIQDDFKERAVKVVPIRVERSLSRPTPEDLDSKMSRDFHAVRAYYEKVKGRGIVDIYDFHLIDKQVSDRGAKAYLVVLMALYPENLQDHVLHHFPLGRDRAVALMTDLAEVLERLSGPVEDAFLFTDLKPSNLLVTRDGRLVIGDLGGLKRISSISTLSGSQVSPSWCAPEILIRGERPEAPAMVYAYGLVSHFIWEGRLPYEGLEFSERSRRIRDGGLPFQHAEMPEKIRYLIGRCLAFDPENRPQGFAEMLRELRGDFSGGGAAAGFIPAPQHTATAVCGQAGAGIRTVERAGEARSSGTSGPGETWKDPVSGMVFVKVPGKGFDMGCIGNDPSAAPNEKPAHRVAVDDFWIGKTPVTQSQWQKLSGNNPSHFRKGDDHPVEQISWSDAVSFAKKLTGLHEGTYRFWLPTEAQWEFAARSGGLAELFAGGADADRCAWHRGNSGYSTHRVGQKAPNGLGLHDMSGNVMEWCADVYAEEAYRQTGAIGREREGSAVHRACRGGSWTHAPHRCRTTARKGVPAGLRYSFLGFRLVRSG